MSKYKRTLAELREHAILYWSPEIIEQAASISVLPLLLKTQDKFISLLNLADATPTSWKNILQASEKGDLKGNVFLKHLMVLSDVGGEALNKYPPLSRFFPDGIMKYIWRERTFEYQFQKIQNRIPLANPAIKVDAPQLIRGYDLDAKMEDVAMLLLYAGYSVGDTLPEDFKEKCIIGGLIGKSEDLESLVKQNYIRINGIIGGAISNAMGHFAQSFVMERLEKWLPEWKFKKDGTLPCVRHKSDDAETTFDVVGTSPNKTHFAIAVDFHTDRKIVTRDEAEKAASLAKRVRAAGHSICCLEGGIGDEYVRVNAISKYYRRSDFTTEITKMGIKDLVKFMRNKASCS